MRYPKPAPDRLWEVRSHALRLIRSGSPILALGDGGHLVQSERTPEVLFEVEPAGGSEYRCECGGFAREGACKHVEAVRMLEHLRRVAAGRVRPPRRDGSGRGVPFPTPPVPAVPGAGATTNAKGA